MRLRCPHCNSKAVIRSSRVTNPKVTEMYVQCTNVECSHAWKAVCEAVHSIAPSMTPMTGLGLQFIPRHKRTDLPVPDQLPLPGMGNQSPNPRAMSPDTG